MTTPNETLPASQLGESLQDQPQIEPSTWEPGGKFGVVLLTGTFVLIALLILGDAIGSMFFR